MACALTRDTSGRCTFTAKTGSTVTVKVTANGNVRIVAARLNSSDLPVQNGDTVSFTVATEVNLVEFVLAVADPDDTITIAEDCGNGQTQILKRFKNDPDDPVTGFSVCGS